MLMLVETFEFRYFSNCPEELKLRKLQKPEKEVDPDNKAIPRPREPRLLVKNIPIFLLELPSSASIPENLTKRFPIYT